MANNLSMRSSSVLVILLLLMQVLALVAALPCGSTAATSSEDASCDIDAYYGDVLVVSTCDSTSGASGTGDTVLSVMNGCGDEVMYSDNNPTQCGAGSKLAHISQTVYKAGTYSVRAYCADGQSCNARVSYTIETRR